jgi:hypothetical protein
MRNANPRPNSFAAGWCASLLAVAFADPSALAQLAALTAPSNAPDVARITLVARAYVAVGMSGLAAAVRSARVRVAPLAAAAAEAAGSSGLIASARAARDCAFARVRGVRGRSTFDAITAPCASRSNQSAGERPAPAEHAPAAPRSGEDSGGCNTRGAA